MKKSVFVYVGKSDLNTLNALVTKEPDNVDCFMVWNNSSGGREQLVEIVFEGVRKPFWYTLKTKLKRIWVIIKE